jgi:hypothetical protein
MRTLATDPLIPGPLWTALAVVSFAALAAYLAVKPPRVSPARRAVVGVLLGVGLAGILALLLNPTWEEMERSRLVRPALGVMVDTSGSMDTPDCSRETRLRAAADLAQQLRDQLAEDFEVRLWRFDTELRALRGEDLSGLAAEGLATDLGGCVQRALSSGLGEEAALVVLSDGIHNVPETLSEVAKGARTARAMAVPVFTRTFGADAVVEDLSLELATPDDVAFVGREVPIRVLVRHPGIPQGSAEVTLRAGDEVLATRRAEFSGDVPGRVEFPVQQDAPGLYRYVVWAAPLPKEVVRANNERVFYLRVIDTPIRVLVLEGKPYWDFKFLLRSLAGDPGISVTGAVRIKDARVILREFGRDQTKSGSGQPAAESAEVVKDGATFLSSYDELKQYQIIILGRDSQVFLPAANVENVLRWIGEWGGSVVCARGRPLPLIPERMDAIMPVRWKATPETRFRVQLTPEAEFMGWFPSAAPLMPSLATGAEVEEVKALATVVARTQGRGAAEGMAAVTYQPYGSGRVVVLEGSGLWRWAFLTAGGKPHEEIYGRFWNSLLRWLAASADFLPGETASLRATQTVYTALDRVVMQLAVRDDPEVSPDSTPLIAIRSGTDGRAVDTVAAMPTGGAPGIFRATTGPLPIGPYVAELVRRQGERQEEAATGAPRSVRCAFDVQAPVQERLDLRARPGLMQRLAEESGGEALSDKPAEQIRTVYMEHWQARHPEEFRRTPAWDRMGFLLALAAVMGAAWVVRRRGGLI